jgi:predicted nucleic acid-binding protein
VSLPRYLLDTSAFSSLVRDEATAAPWRRDLSAGHLAICAVTELEILFSARSKADRDSYLHLIRATFDWVVMPERVFDRAAEVQAVLTDQGTHRSAGPVDLLVAAAAELHGLVLLHYDRDFLQIARATGQRLRWVAEPGSVD